MLDKKHVTIREFAQMIGKMVAAEPGVEYAPLYYKPFELVKNHNLKRKRGNFDSFMRVPGYLKPDFKWWIKNLPHHK